MTPIDVLVAQPGWFVVTAALVGLAIGSFLNVVIHRLPVVLEREWRRDCAELTGTPAEPDPPDLAHDDAPRYNLVVPRSHCPACWHQITVAENIPVLSYLWLRGRCSSCGSPISARYPLVELLTACLSGVVAWRFGFGLAAGGAIVLTWALIALTFIDLDTQLLPDDITLPFLWIGLSVNLVGTYSDLQSGVIGAIAGYGFFSVVFQLFRLATGKEGMGGGDFKLLAMLGAWQGWQALPLIVVMSSFVGAVAGVAMMLTLGRDRNVPIPFGPYLAVAGWISLLWGDAITSAYLDFATPTGPS